MTEPLAQLGTRRDIFQPFGHHDVSTPDSARPEAFDEEDGTTLVGASWS
jgi:hypothetical protein